MFRFIARRFLQTIPVLFIIATLTFFLMKSTKGDIEKKMRKGNFFIKKIEIYMAFLYDRFEF